MYIGIRGVCLRIFVLIHVTSRKYRKTHIARKYDFPQSSTVSHTVAWGGGGVVSGHFNKTLATTRTFIVDYYFSPLGDALALVSIEIKVGLGGLLFGRIEKRKQHCDFPFAKMRRTPLPYVNLY